MQDGDKEEFHTQNRKRAERALKEVIILFAIIMVVTLYEFLFDK